MSDNTIGSGERGRLFGMLQRLAEAPSDKLSGVLSELCAPRRRMARGPSINEMRGIEAVHESVIGRR
jgi:hypothetical protein